MVEISNGKIRRKVTIGAYNAIYKSKGYRIVGGRRLDSIVVPTEPVATNEPVSDVVSEPVVEEVEPEWISELLEKPISQWSKEEVTSFVKEKGIDTSSARKLSEVKDIIKKWLEEQGR